MDEKRYIKEVLDWYRGEDAGDLRVDDLSELVENMSALNAFKEKSEISLKIEKSEKSNQNIVVEKIVKKSVMDDTIVKNSVMDEQIVKNSLMNAKTNIQNWWLERCG